jgi:hypothetical protein
MRSVFQNYIYFATSPPTQKRSARIPAFTGSYLSRKFVFVVDDSLLFSTMVV